MKFVPNSNIKLVLPLIALVILTGASVYYYQNYMTNPNTDPGVYSTQLAKNEGIVLGDADSPDSSSQSITSGTEYQLQVVEFKKPVNEGFQELTEKAKYKNLFTNKDIQAIVDKTRDNANKMIDELKNFNIAEKFQSANEQYITSVEYLVEALNAYEKSMYETDKAVAQQQRELFSYKVEQSNNLLSKIQIPK